jgi:DNA-binding CsgD family transcriptional regulator
MPKTLCLDLEHACECNAHMSPPRKKKPSRIGPQQTNRYFHVLTTPLHLVTRKEPATRESRTNPLTGGRRSTDRDTLDLYDLWLSLSPRERQITYLTCQGYKNQQIAFQMGITVGTVKSYLEHVYNKIDVRSKADLRLKFFDFDFTSNPP